MLSLITIFLGHFSVRVMPILRTGILGSQLLSGICVLSVGGSLPLSIPSNPSCLEDSSDLQTDSGVDQTGEKWNARITWFTSFDRSRPLRYDLPSSLYRSYSHFIPIHCYDVPYSLVTNEASYMCRRLRSSSSE
ncbi:hypothetical protein T459_12521 [Capsicum annuum]|uniref:Uncharacterized protein n=1 Tax=Capsicum annuum TaxID=4072 RepID=A0A2G2ZQ20_CAPAN|nr:hypothetical protein T459_12521 [Capsicum annuum]